MYIGLDSTISSMSLFYYSKKFFPNFKQQSNMPKYKFLLINILHKHTAANYQPLHTPLYILNSFLYQKDLEFKII